MKRRRWKPSTAIDLEQCMARHRRWGGDPVNIYEGAVFRRVTGTVPYASRQLPGGAIEVTARNPADATLALADLRSRLAEGLDPAPLQGLARRDRVIRKALRRRPGYRPPVTPDLLESLVTSITAQQVNLTWATTTRRRLVERYGRRRRFDGRLLWEFPGADVLAGARHADIRSLQLTNSKAAYIIGVATAVAAGRFAGIEQLGDDDAISMLTATKGVGQWTAEWTLARCLARPSVVAAADLGVRQAIGMAYLGRRADEGEVRLLTTPWGHAANWATHLLLEGLND